MVRLKFSCQDFLDLNPDWSDLILDSRRKSGCQVAPPCQRGVRPVPLVGVLYPGILSQLKKNSLRVVDKCQLVTIHSIDIPPLTSSLDKSVVPSLPWDAFGNLGQTSVRVGICRAAEIRVSPYQVTESNLQLRDLMWWGKTELTNPRELVCYQCTKMYWQQCEDTWIEAHADDLVPFCSTYIHVHLSGPGSGWRASQYGQWAESRDRLTWSRFLSMAVQIVLLY